VPTPEQTIDRIQGRFGRHDGARALHAKGTLCRGTFTPAPVARTITRAAVFAGDPVPATVRLSNGGGDPTEADYAPDVRGLAVKLYGPGGEKLDLSTQSAPRFPVGDVDSFLDLVEASERSAKGLARLPLFALRHPKFVTSLPANASALKLPASYATLRYFGIHAYRWSAADGSSRFVRYRFLPAAGVETISGKEGRRRGRDYLRDDLVARLAQGPVRFALEVQIAAVEDDPDDPTAHWPEDRDTATVGTLEVTGLETERETGGDVVVFDPTRVVDGIELSNDPILLARSRAYSASVERRTGVRRPDALDGASER
jgi:catalase